MTYDELHPCRYCTTEREIGCHSHCEKYLKAQEFFTKKREERVRENDVKDYTIKQIVRAVKSKNERKTKDQ